jgi:hypothetical protein
MNSQWDSFLINAWVETVSAHQEAPVGCVISTIGDVHRDFKAKAHVACRWFFPCHSVSPE